MTNYSGMTARDLPEARQDLIDWAAGRGGQVLAQHGGGPLGPIIATSARHAELYYVNADMTALARQIGAGLDVYALAAEDLPARSGLLVWDNPATSERPGAAPTAVLWTSTGTRIMISLLCPTPAYRAWCTEVSTDATAAAPLVTAGRLVYRGRGPTLPLDGPDTPWDRLRFVDHEESTRTLLATLILIRQPVDARRSLHEVEDVAPSKASRKRIVQAGGDPTSTVRYVTLRQNLRRNDHGTADSDHARRVYQHRWFVRMHRRRYPDREDPAGWSKKWVGPYFVVPRGCEDAPIIGGDRVNVLRR
ncbi:hypothetical protein [Streptomyces triculaminicus]|uniref:hypothetical protein n=1 Tax=Streptomyces triculaminicus TaxID=2816232 RepID=UPI0037964696